MTLESDAKFQEKLVLGFNNDMTNMVKFNVSIGKSEKLHFDVLLLSIPHKISAKNVQKSSLMTLKSGPNFKEKLTFCLKNDIRNLMNFNSSSEKSENLHFERIFLSKVCNVWGKIMQTSCVVKSDFWLQKWHNEFGEFSHR